MGTLEVLDFSPGTMKEMKDQGFDFFAASNTENEGEDSTTHAISAIDGLVAGHAYSMLETRSMKLLEFETHGPKQSGPDHGMMKIQFGIRFDLKKKPDTIAMRLMELSGWLLTIS